MYSLRISFFDKACFLDSLKSCKRPIVSLSLVLSRPIFETRVTSVCLSFRNWVSKGDGHAYFSQNAGLRQLRSADTCDKAFCVTEKEGSG